MELVITPKEGCLLWENQPKDEVYERYIHLLVPTGCQAFLFVDGVISNTYNEGGYNLDLKTALKSNKRLLFLGASCDKSFVLPIGVGSVGFYDRKTKSEMVAGIHGQCTLRVVNGQHIFRTFSKTTVTMDEVSERIRGDLQQEIISVLSKQLEDSDYRTIGSEISKMSSDIKERYGKIFFEEGIELVGFSLGAPVFSKADEQKLEEKIFTDEEWLKTLVLEEKTRVCPKCGTKNDRQAKFCPVCGTELK